MGIKTKINAVKEFITTNLSKASRVKMKKASMRVIIFICLTYAFSVILYLAGWIYQWAAQEKLQLEQLLALISEFSKPATVAFFGFLATSFVDENSDGIPDKFQEKKEDK